MSAVVELLGDLAARGVRVWGEGGKLRWSTRRGSLPDDLRERLVREKEPLLAWLARLAEPAGPPLLAGPPGPAPLSFAQERMYFLWRRDPSSPAYNVPLRLRLAGPLDRGALAFALAETVRRHAVLRSRFLADESGRPVACPGPPGAVPLPVLDLSALPPARREEEAEQQARAALGRPFDLARQGPLSARLLCRGEDEHLLLLTLHHIATDGESIGMLVAELAALYAARLGGGGKAFADPPLQYADFARWQRAWAESPEGRRALALHLAFWKEALTGLPPLELPADRKPAAASWRGVRRPAALPAPLVRGLAERVRRASGGTLFGGLLALFEVLLHRLSGQLRFAVGVPVAGRGREEVERMIGLFVNTLVLPADLTGGPGMEAAAAAAGRALLAAQSHEEIPIEHVVRELRPDRGGAHTPLFSVLLSYLPAPATPPRPNAAGGLTLVPEPADTGAAQLDLTLSLAGGEDGVAGYLEGRADLFDLTTLERWRGHLVRLLEAALADPLRPVDELPILGEAERQALAVEPAAREELPAPLLPAAFATWARQSPDAVAVSGGGEALSYGELEVRSRRLALWLRELGAGPEVAVGLLLERSPALVVAVVGTARSGAAWMPLDPAYPEDRLRFLLADARPGVLVAAPDLVPAAGGLPAVPTVCLSPGGRLLSCSGRAAEAAPGEEGPLPEPPAAATAYLIYTSGSTGRPKGVAVTHGNAARLFAAAARCFGFAPGDAWSLFHSYAFDFSVWELWGALSTGGRVVLVPRGVARSPEAMLHTLREEGVTVLSQTPSAFRALVAADRGGELPLRQVVFGGEALAPAVLAPWIARRGDRTPRLINMYGITETTVHVTWREMTAADLPAGRSAVGRPLADLTVHLLDPHLVPMPLGVAGEIAVGGAGVARGYAGRPELTAVRFVPDPFAAARGEAGARLYKSGDLARRLPDGDLEYLGRADQQVKVRGHRVEPGEIEAVLARQPGIREAVVVARRDAGAEIRLVAYYVAVPGEAPAPYALRRALAAALPEPLVPAAFVALEALPLSAHGKLDRAALPAPGAARPDLEHAYEPPRTSLEEALAAVWSEGLGVDRVGRDDNFFSLGGDSMLSLRLCALAERRGLPLNVEELFSHPTVAALAAVVEGRGSKEGPAAPAASPAALSEAERARVPRGVVDAYPLAHLQEGMLFHGDLEPGAALYHDVFRHHLRARFDGPALGAAAKELFARHPVLRTSFDLAGPGRPLSLVHRRVEPPLAVVDWRGVPAALQEERLGEWAAREAVTPFDWRRPPLLRLFVHRRSEESFEVALSFHHAILDGWSVASLLTELLGLYLGLLAGEAPAAVEPDRALAEHVALEQAVLASPEARRAWGQMLEGAAFSPLPRWPRRLEEEGAGVGEVIVRLPGDLSQRLERLARRLGVPVKQVLLAAHCKALMLAGGGRDLVTGLVSHGRPEEARGERALGLFLNTLPLRVVPAPGSWIDLVRQVGEAERRAFPWRRFPLAELQRERGGSPLFDTAFNFVHFHVYEGIAGLPGVEVLGGATLERTSLPLLVHFYVDPFDRRFTLSLRHALGEIGREQVIFLGDLYGGVLEALAGDPEARHEGFSALSAATRHQVLVDWNDTDHPLGDLCLHDLVAAAAARVPEAPAVVDAAGRGLTYRELQSRARRLAGRLQAVGVGPDVAVGLYLDRSLEMMVAVLAVLEAGGACLPLDPSYPEERLRLMLAEARSPLVLTRAGLPARLMEAGSLLPVDEEPGAPAPAFPPPPVTADHLAYVLFTSGSTGRPKGVAMPHRPLVNLVSWQVRSSDEVGRGRTLQFAALSFDVSFQEIFSTWAAGGTLVLIGEEERRDPRALLSRLATERVERLFLPFVALQQLAAAPVPATAPALALREVITAGEALQVTPQLIELWQAISGCRLENQYGPTEAHVVTRHALAGDPAGWPLRPPVGRPIANSRVFVLGPGFAPVPVGATGEVFLGGATLARGYLGRPEWTAERFVPGPFAGLGDGEPGSRLYRTGDLGRLRPDGEIELLGRADDQQKVRGFRVEPGEVEQALSRHPAVAQAVVVVQGGGDRERHLAAFVVATGGEALSPAELRTFLAGSLPDFMIPDGWTLLPGLPLTPSGKVDRRALVLLEAAPAETGAPFEAPRGVVEETLAGIWEELLGRRIGRHDGFVELGGHSLAATRAAARVRAALGVDLPLRELFEAPSLAALARRVEELRRGGWEAGDPPLSPVGREVLLPASWAQRRLWFLDRLEPASPAYNLPFALHLEGPLDAGRLTWALSEIGRRHESLRTTFEAVEGEPHQRIHPPIPPPLPRIDLGALPAAAAEAEACRLASDEARRPFDLAAGPLWRTTLLALGGESHRLLVDQHHAVSDGWSLGILAKELGVLYGSTDPLPELPIQYADFAVWQRRRLDHGRLEEGLERWRSLLAGASRSLALPADRNVSSGRPPRAARVSLALGGELSAAVRGLARSATATPFLVLLAALQATLGRLAGQDDLLVGTPVAGRTRPEVEGLIGCFVNTLVLRGDLAGDPDMRSLLARTRGRVLEAFDLEEIPFERVVEALAPERDLSRPPLFQVLFALQNAPWEGLTLPGLAARIEPLSGGTAKLDLVVSLSEGADGFSGTVEHDADRFDTSTIARLVRRFRSVLEAAAGSPERPFSALLWLLEGERHQLLAEWGEGDPLPDSALLLHDFFERQAAATPQAVAVVAGNLRVSYGELAARARGLAGALAELGIGPEARVGVLLERGADLVAALLGVLMAGGAYVPLEPAHPDARLASVAGEAGLSAVVVSPGLEPRLALPAGVPVLRAWPERGGERAPSRRPLPANLAYLIYTSGSTGCPKGVALTHANAVALVHWTLATFPRRELTAVLASTSVAFDISVFEIFVPLSSGGRVVLARDALDLAALPARDEVTQINTVPSACAALLRLGPLPPALAGINLGGEALPRALAGQVHALAPGMTLRNLYGPSEDTTFSTVAEVGEEPGPPAIGRPVAGTRAMIADGRLEPVPAGVVGELYLAGMGLARGYLGRPDLTAERFGPDPFSPLPGGRLYRTGDLARFRADGQIELLGRRDHQVKVRGFRVELGEIEQALAAHPAVLEAAVAVHGQEEPAGPVLAAYVVPAGAAPLTAPELRDFLARTLPAAWLPAVYVSLQALPRNANGKLDRARLPAPERAARQAGGAPRSLLEEALAEAWADLLGVDRIGRDDDFFELGGHSLLAARLTARLRASLGVELPVRAVFEAPTVARLAQRAEAVATLGSASPPLPPLVPVPRREPPLLSFSQERLWFLDRLEPGSAAYNLPVGLRLSGPLDPSRLAACLSEVVHRHEALRTVFREREGWPVQVVLPPAPFPLPVVDLAALPEGAAEAGRLRAAEAGRPFDLEAGPLCRGILLRRAPGEHELALTLHHAVADGGSLGVLLGETTELYAASLAGRPSPLPPPALQYADFAVWQRGWLAGEALDSRLAFWRRHLAGVPPVLDLPRDRPPSTAAEAAAGRAESFPLDLPEERIAALRRLARGQGATLYMALLALFQALLGRLADQEDFAVGTPVHGRGRAELEGMIGFFANTLALRAELSGDPTFLALLGRVRETALAAHAEADLPFGKLVEALAPERSLTRTPLFQAMFAFDGAPPPPSAIPGLDLEPLHAANGAAQFDLSLGLAESGEGRAAGGLEVVAGVFDSATGWRMARAFERLAAAVAGDPEVRFSDLPLLGEEERLAVARAASAVTPAPRRSTLGALFERQAEAAPEAVAVVAEGGRLTYGEIEAHANRLARHLLRLGLEAEDRVAVHLARSPGQVVAVLAVWKAGGVYLPLDPSLPEPRRLLLLEDSGARFLIGDGSFVGEGVTVVRPDDAAAETAGRPEVSVLPGQLAYLLYTSGSTGRPKGVAVEHGAAADHVVTWMRELSVERGDRFLQLAALSFDASIEQVAGPLAMGATVALAPPEPWPAAELSARMRELAVTGADLPPAYWQAWLREGEPDAVPSLKKIAVGGEALLWEAARQWYRLPVSRRVGFLNSYGPTEAVVTATCYAVPRSGGRGAAVPLGRPLAHRTALVLDRLGNPVPPGVAGELCLGGILARGYHGRPEQTAERFVPDPLGGPGGRIYRTGDRVRAVPEGEGTFEFLGRLDFQVQVRGIRLEPGEVEAVLAEFPGVREQAVVLHREGTEDARLVAYLAVAVGETPPAAPELRAFLAARLPRAAVPSSFVVLPALPRTPAGKLDRNALPAPPRPEERAGVAPRGATEEVLATLWADVLGRERVGIEDSFFELGGHSLLAARLAARVRAVFGVDLPLRELFENPTVAALARRIVAAGTLEPALVPAPAEERSRLSLAQVPMWLADQRDPGDPAYDLPLALRIEGELDPRALAAALSGLLVRHEALRARFVDRGDGPRQLFDPPPAVASPVPEVDLGGLPPAHLDTEAGRLAAAEAVYRFDLERGPLLRAVLVRRAARDHALLLNLHHIAADGASVDVLLRDLTELYRAHVEGRPTRLAPLPLQHADHAAWQRRLLTGEGGERARAYWRERLGGALPRLELPLGRPRPERSSGRGAAVPLILDAAETAALGRLARGEGATPFMVLLSAFKTFLAAATGQTDLRVGSPAAFRDRPELADLVGLFLDVLVLRTSLAGDPTFLEVLGRVRQTALGAYAHALPLSQVEEALAAAGGGPERGPLYEAWFVLQARPFEGGAGGVELSGLRLSEIAVPFRHSKFDLAVNLAETPRGLYGRIEYSTDRLDAGAAVRLAAGYRAALAVVLARPGSRLSELAGPVAQAMAAADEGHRSRFRDALRSTHIRGARRTAAAAGGSAS